MLCERLNILIFNSDQLTIEDGAFANCENVRKLIFTKGKPVSISSKMLNEDGRTPDGKSFITYFYDKNGEIFPYPTLYYTAAYADEWAPNGETEWNGYTIQQISQEELDAILAEARGETVLAVSSSPLPTSDQQVATPTPVVSNAETAPAPGIEGILLTVIGVAAIAVAVVLGIRLRKKK